MPGKQWFFQGWKRLQTPPFALRKHLRIQGPFTTQLPGGRPLFLWADYDHYIENELFWTGFSFWEKDSIHWWMQEVQRHQVVYDIGANTGVYSLVAKALNTQAEVYAFEPIPSNRARLAQQAALNQMEVSVWPVAISNQTGEGTFYINPKEHYTASLEAAQQQQGAQPLKVPTYRLDDLLALEGLPIPSLIKIDVEGHEAAAFEGMQNLLVTHKPILLCEVLSIANLQEYMAALPQGYRLYDPKAPKQALAPSQALPTHRNYIFRAVS